MHLFGKEEVNTGRQFEFDMAKAVCIFGMIVVHCFEELATGTVKQDSTGYYIFVTVLDSIFGAGTFMISMGIGIAYNREMNADTLIRRGARIFLFGYILNFLRGALPSALVVLAGKWPWLKVWLYLFATDIMPFAGLALLLLGLLKKQKLSDGAIFLTALAMSAVGSFVRFIPIESPVGSELLGILIGTLNAKTPDGMSCFPLLNWFIVVVIGYLYGKALRRCRDRERYYTLSFLLSGLILAVYMAIAIPRRLGMMNEDIAYYYHFSAPNALILFLGAIFASGLYHFIARLLPERVKAVITDMSRNLNRTYCLQWLLIGWMRSFLAFIGSAGLGNGAVAVASLLIYLISTVLAKRFTLFSL